MTVFKFRNVILLAFSLFTATMLLNSCGDGKEEQQKKQIEELTKEINQIDSIKGQLELQYDSLTKEKDNLLQTSQTEKQNAADLLAKLQKSNAALYTAQNEKEKWRKQMEEWKGKAEKLAAENAQLKQTIVQLTTRAEQAELKLAQSEERLAAAEAKIREYQATLDKTVFVSKVDIEAFKGDEKFKKDQIKRSANRLKITVSLGRPDKVASNVTPKLSLKIVKPDGATYHDEQNLQFSGDNCVIDLDLKNRKLDKGRYTVDVYETTSAARTIKRFEGSFVVSSAL